MATRARNEEGWSERLRDLTDGRWLTLEPRLPLGGSLQARRLAGGAVQLYWRYSHEGKGHREPIGFHDPKSPPKQLTATAQGFGRMAAIERCRELAKMHGDHLGGLREVNEEAAKAHAARKVEEVERGAKTLAALLAVYVAYLKAQGRRSWYDAAQIFRLHVEVPWPKVASKPAADVTPDEILDMLRRLAELGKGRSANKLRSYLRAAYQCAIDVRATASIPVAFKAFRIAFNPAAQTRRDPKHDRADKNPLSLAELRTYWHRIRRADGLAGSALRLHLLTGGQRIEQLVRLKTRDVKDDSLTIFDAKGRPGHEPRPHMLPITADLAAAIGPLPQVGEFVLSTRSGDKHISTTTLAGWARAIVGNAIAGFQLKRVRSGVETLLAANGLSREIRGHLQSHGLTGVQAKHYDGHDYMPEKRHALELLHALLERQAKPNVVEFAALTPRHRA